MQIGPGIITVNDTDRYERKDFEARTSKAVETLFSIYQDYKGSFEVNRTLLRYIDAVKLESDSEEVLDFLKNKLKVSIELQDSLFQDTGIERKNPGLDLRLSFPCLEPKGRVHLRIFTGHKDKDKAIMWETMIESQGEDAPMTPIDISKWIETADDIIHDWFFKLIEGDLLRRFE